MCLDPISGAALAMTAVQAAGSIAQGIAANETAKANANLANLEGKQAMRSALADEALVRYNGRRFLSELRAKQAASGIDIAQGSPVEVGAEKARDLELEALRARYPGQSALWRKKVEAQRLKEQGQVALMRSVFDAGTSLLSAGLNHGWFSPATGKQLQGMSRQGLIDLRSP